MKLKIKYFLLIALPIVLLSACSNANPESKGGDFQVKGKLSNAHGELIYFEKMAPDGIKPLENRIVDANGEFSFTSPITEIGFYRLRISDKNFATFIFEPHQQVTVTADASDLGATYRVEGSPETKLFVEVSHASSTNYKQRDSLQKKFEAFVSVHQGDSVRIDSINKALEKPYMALIKDQNTYLVDFIAKNNTSFASLAAIQQLPIADFVSTYIAFDKTMFAKYPNSPYVKIFHQDIRSKTACAVGAPAPEIKFNMPNGKPLALSSLKGKVVLVDFWASWCGPCRMENPNVVRAYNAYKSKGFDVYSVSLDSDLNRWIQAIQKDNLSWKNHVCDFKGWQSPVVADYNFNGIPSNVLLDKNGNVIAKNLRGIDLENKLAEVFK